MKRVIFKIAVIETEAPADWRSERCGEIHPSTKEINVTLEMNNGDPCKGNPARLEDFSKNQNTDADAVQRLAAYLKDDLRYAVASQFEPGEILDTVIATAKAATKHGNQCKKAPDDL